MGSFVKETRTVEVWVPTERQRAGAVKDSMLYCYEALMEEHINGEQVDPDKIEDWNQAMAEAPNPLMLANQLDEETKEGDEADGFVARNRTYGGVTALFWVPRCRDRGERPTPYDFPTIQTLFDECISVRMANDPELPERFRKGIMQPFADGTTEAINQRDFFTQDFLSQIEKEEREAEGKETED